MILDELYVDVMARLLDAERPSLGIATVDWDNEQPERLEDGDLADGLRLPAVLFSYQEPEWRHTGRLGYRADTTFTLRVVRDLVGEGMANDASEARVAATRASYEQLKAIAQRVVGMAKAGTYGTVGLATKDTDHTFRRIRVDSITFRVLLHSNLDPNTYELRERPALAIGTNPPMAVPSVLQQRIDTATPGQVVAAIQASPNGPAIEDELCDCPDPSGPTTPVEIRNSEGTLQGTVQSGDPPFTAADGVLRTTDNSVVVQTIPSGKVEQAPQSQVRYTAADGSEQLTAAVNTGYAGTTLRPATVVPRFIVLRPDTTVVAYRDIAEPTYTEANELYFDFRVGDAISAELVMPAGWSGLYSTITTDGGSGSVVLQQLIGAAWTTLLVPEVGVGATIRALRTITTTAGWANFRTA